MDEQNKLGKRFTDLLDSTVTKEDVVKLFALLQNAIQEVKRGLEDGVAKGNTDTMAMCEQMLADLTKFETDIKKTVEKRDMTLFDQLSKSFAGQIDDVRKLIPTIPDQELYDDTELKNQIAVLMAYESPKLEAIEARDALETLKDDERLDASAIKNLPEATKTVVEGMNKALALYMLIDMDLSGIIAGQSIKWDGIRWIPYTPAGGTGNTVVYNEVVSGSGTSFVLANTPVAGTLRVYANGQRLLPTVDYTLATATITTLTSWDAGTVSADYEW